MDVDLENASRGDQESAVNEDPDVGSEKEPEERQAEVRKVSLGAHACDKQVNQGHSQGLGTGDLPCLGERERETGGSYDQDLIG